MLSHLFVLDPLVDYSAFYTNDKWEPIVPYVRILSELDVLGSMDISVENLCSSGSMHDNMPKSEDIKKRSVTFHNGGAESF